MQVTTDISKVKKNVQSELTFTFVVLQESLISFVSFLVFLTIKNVVIFTKTSFYRKQNSVIMCNYMETFHANIGHNLA